MSGKAVEDYSTNPSTVKARRRKMNLSGAKKVEDAARTADYKAMYYARKVIQAKPSFQAALYADKVSMLERAMRETMEKRRVKGQDTMSKLAAYHAEDPRVLDAGVTGRQPQVPIGPFLEKHGFVPARGDCQSQDADPVTLLNNSTHSHQTEGHSPASCPGMGGPGKSSTSNRDSKMSDSTAPFTDMTPESLNSIELDPSDEMAALHNKASHPRNLCQSVMSSNNQLGEYELGAEKNCVAKLDERLSHLEGVVQAIQCVSAPAVVDRVAAVEGAMKELRMKLGEGCDGEVAKMREAFGSLREALARMGNFL